MYCFVILCLHLMTWGFPLIFLYISGNVQSYVHSHLTPHTLLHCCILSFLILWCGDGWFKQPHLPWVKLIRPG
uniref:Uncharacterized protein n=1 Tax=Anguilla anguilla TaxID=7936 RepID=A0A0E9XAX1_ANGAN